MPTRPAIRRIDRQRPPSFDEQLWPVNLAILVLAGFVEGIIIARLPLADPPNLIQNGWTWTATVAATLLFGLWFVARIDNQRLRRRAQLATVLSLFLHALIFVAVNHDYLLPLPPEEMALEVPQEFTPPVVLRDYDPATFRERQQPDFERLAPTQTPDRPAELSRPQRQQPKPVETAIPSPPVAEPVREPVQPTPADVRRPDENPAHRSEPPGLTRRLTGRSDQPQSDRASAPAERSTAQAAPTRIDAQDSPARSAASSPPSPRRDATQPPATTAQPRDIQNPRRTSDQRQLVESSPSAPRRPTTSRSTEPTRVESPTGAVADTPRQTRPDQPAPRAVGERRLATSPQVGSSAQPPNTASESVAPRAEAQARPSGASEPAPSAVTRSDRAPAARRPLSDVPPAQAPAVAPEVSPGAVGAVASNVEAAATDAARGSSGAVSTSSSPAGVASSSSSVAPAVTRSTRASDRTADSLAASATATPRRGPASSPEQAAAAPGTSLADAPRAARPNPTPGSSAPTRSFQGLTGTGRSQNFDEGPAAVRNPASVASAAARRPTPTSQDASASGLTASLPAAVPRRRAGAALPTSTNPADASEGGLAAASETPRREIDADASAALAQGGARAPLGRETADAGPANIDTGPTRVVSETGQDRPGGGGQPTIGEVNPSPTVLRRRAGGQPAVDATPAEALAAQAPTEASAPGAGTAPQVGARDAAIARSASSGGPTSTGEPRSAAGPAIGADAIVSESPTGGRSAAETGGDVGVTGALARGSRRATASSDVAASPGDVPILPGDPASAGPPAGAGVDAQGTQDVRTAASEPPGSSRRSDGLNTAAQITTPGSVAGAAHRSTDAGFDPQGATASVAGGTRRRSPEIGAITAAASAADALAAGAAPTAEVTPKSGPLAGGQTGAAGRRDGGPQGITVGPEGPAGHGPQPSPQLGATDRAVTPQAATVSPVASRQPRRTPASVPSSVDTSARLPSELFGDRKGRRYLDAPATGPPGSVAKTEDAIEAGLEFLARRQSTDGRWSLHEFPGRPQGEAPTARAIHSDTAATGLALLAFLGAAYDHYGDRYQHAVNQGVKWLVSQQQSDGNLYVSHDRRSDQSAVIYSHAIATIALCEAYGMTGDSSLREPAQKAIDFLVRTQHPDHGGWRYAVKSGVQGYSSDTSVTGWAVMALKSGELAKLKVSKRAYQGVAKWLDYAQGGEADGSRYKYNPNAALDPSLQRNLAHSVTPTMTSVGLLSRLYIGWNREHKSMVAGAKYLTAYPPDISANQLRDTYYWYYATQVLFHMGGDFWRKWNQRLHPLLIDTQLRQGPLAGSWDPQHDVWGAAAGRIYVTTMNLLSLEVYYRHLPLYEDTAR